jgi:hypothetical protein
VSSREKQEKALDALLGSLPRLRARPGFADEVLARAARRGEAGAERARRAGRPRLRLAMAGALLACGGVVAGVWIQQATRRSEIAEEIATLKREHARLSSELSRLREQAGCLRPVVYLGGDERADYVLDLRKLVGAAGDGARGDVASKPGVAPVHEGGSL